MGPYYAKAHQHGFHPSRLLDVRLISFIRYARNMVMSLVRMSQFHDDSYVLISCLQFHGVRDAAGYQSKNL